MLCLREPQFHCTDLIVRNEVVNTAGDAVNSDLGTFDTAHPQQCQHRLQDVVGDEFGELSLLDEAGEAAWTEHKDRNAVYLAIVGGRYALPEAQTIGSGEIFTEKVITNSSFQEMVR